MAAAQGFVSTFFILMLVDFKFLQEDYFYVCFNRVNVSLVINFKFDFDNLPPG